MTTLVIGGGWSGLATTVSLIKQGHAVHLVESATQVGGRARNVTWQGKMVDNGQHIMIGAYDHMLAMMQLVGVSPDDVFDRLPIDISIHNPHYSTLHLSGQSRLPWPWSLAWNLVRSAGLNSLKSLVTLQKDIPRLLAEDDVTVLAWLERANQPKRLIEQLWEPLCLAILNTQVNKASAQVLAIVLSDSLGRDEPTADLLIPKIPLGRLFPQAAADYIQQQGGKISKQTRIAEVVVEEGQISGAITTRGDFIDSENIILATGPDQTAQLLTAHLRFPKPSQTPITTVYLQYPSHTRLPNPLLGLTGMISHWLFDRSQQHPGLIAVVISSDGPHEKLSKDALVEHVCNEVHQLLPDFPEKAEEGFVIRERRATFECTVENHRQRPACKTSLPGLWLTGDYIENDYPATLEGAIRNGEHCAKLLLSHLTSTEL